MVRLLKQAVPQVLFNEKALPVMVWAFSSTTNIYNP
jgi:hypothetical protein